MKVLVEGAILGMYVTAARLVLSILQSIAACLQLCCAPATAVLANYQHTVYDTRLMTDNCFYRIVRRPQSPHFSATSGPLSLLGVYWHTGFRIFAHPEWLI